MNPMGILFRPAVLISTRERTGIETMKIASKFACALLLTWVAALPALAQNYYYVRSNVNQPWGQSTNEDAMDNVFGSGNWTTLYYEDLSTDTLLSGSTGFIFMEGGDSSFDAFSYFMSHNLKKVSDWVKDGGRLLIMAAPNNPLDSASLTLPDSVVLTSEAFYGSAASSAYAVDITNQIFSGPFSTAGSLTGDFVAHGYFSGGSLRAIMQSNLNEVILAQDPLGSGFMVLGGMTTDNFHLPQPAAHGLLENIIYYAATVSL